MAAIGNLHTVSENHSVREAVMVFILASKVENIESYKKLIENQGPLSPFFDKFDKLKLFFYKTEKNDLTNSTQIRESTERGFKMIGYRNGKTSDILQLLPEKNVSTLTFNTITYESWDQFSENGLRFCKIIGDHDENIRVKAIGIMYVDEFYFDSIDDYEPCKLFNTSSQYLPKNIFHSDFVDLNLNTNQIFESSGKEFIENISIKVFDAEQKKKIRINGNIIIPVEIRSLKEYTGVEINTTREIINLGHNQNKKMLRDILSDNVKILIGI